MWGEFIVLVLCNFFTVRYIFTTSLWSYTADFITKVFNIQFRNDININYEPIQTLVSIINAIFICGLVMFYYIFYDFYSVFWTESSRPLPLVISSSFLVGFNLSDLLFFLIPKRNWNMIFHHIIAIILGIVSFTNGIHPVIKNSTCILSLIELSSIAFNIIELSFYTLTLESICKINKFLLHLYFFYINQRKLWTVYFIGFMTYTWFTNEKYDMYVNVYLLCIFLLSLFNIIAINMVRKWFFRNIVF